MHYVNRFPPQDSLNIQFILKITVFNAQWDMAVTEQTQSISNIMC